MYRVLVADDNYEDRELLKYEIQRALKGTGEDIRFYEAPSVKQARELLAARPFDLLTLDIEFDRLNEGLEVLPEIFEQYPTLSIIVISGKLDKAEVTERLFSFTRQNVLKGKRWARHFDVLDKKDKKDEAILRAYELAFRQQDALESVKELFVMAEGHLEKGEMDKCLQIYRKIQELAPGEQESGENIGLLRGDTAYEQARVYFRRGEKVVAGLLLGHYLETRMKAYTRKVTRRSPAGLFDCMKELEKSRKFSQYKRSLFQNVLKLRNRAIHHPGTITDEDFESALKDLKTLEAHF